MLNSSINQSFLLSTNPEDDVKVGGDEIVIRLLNVYIRKYSFANGYETDHRATLLQVSSANYARRGIQQVKMHRLGVIFIQ